jgi:cell wall-associated NlpC family hydrolase
MIVVPFLNMYEAPSLKAKVVSQALFAEKVLILNSSDSWLEVMTPDGYRGWVEKEGVQSLQKRYLENLEITRIKAHLYDQPDTEFGPLLSLPYGSKLHLLDESDPRWSKVLLPDQRIAYVQKGDLESEPFELSSFAKKFLGLPYTWGGRCSFGFDCSGYVQMLYGKLGILLPRDARQQILDPRAKTISLDGLKLGDLIFWGKSAEQIGHVGMFLEGEEFIHTSTQENKPYLRISQLSDFEWSGHKQAHYPFRTAKRFF